MFPNLLLSGILLLGGSKTGSNATPVTLRPQLSITQISNQAVTPATISFNATNPTTSPSVSGSANAVVSWSSLVSIAAGWNVAVSAPSSFTNCPTVPASAVTVSCVSITGGTLGTCGGSTALSTTPTQIASGVEILNLLSPYVVTLSFTLADSWKYIPSSCSLSVTYTITAN
jgi:hypothetical protein